MFAPSGVIGATYAVGVEVLINAFALPASVTEVPLTAVTVEPRNCEPTTSVFGAAAPSVTALLVSELLVTFTLPLNVV